MSLWLSALAPTAAYNHTPEGVIAQLRPEYFLNRRLCTPKRSNARKALCQSKLVGRGFKSLLAKQIRTSTVKNNGNLSKWGAFTARWLYWSRMKS